MRLWFFVLFTLSEGAFSKGIVSTVPSATEMLRSLHLSEYLVGVSDYCRNERVLPRIGSALVPRLELIARLDPRWVIVPKMAGGGKLTRFLKDRNIRVVSVGIDRLGDLYESLRVLGAHFDRRERAEAVVREIKTALGPPEREREMVLVVVGAMEMAGHYKHITIASRESFYGDILAHRGFRVVSSGQGLYPSVSLEKFSTLKARGLVFITTKKNQQEGLWKKLNTSLKWVRILEGPRYLVPGPDIVNALANLGERE